MLLRSKLSLLSPAPHPIWCQVEVTKMLRGVPKKTGLASEPITRVLEQVSKNGQVLLNPHNICVNLVYSSFFQLENQRRYGAKHKKMVLEKSSIFINFQCKKYCLIQIQNTLPKLDLQRHTIYQIIGNFMRILLNFSYLRQQLNVKEKI